MGITFSPSVQWSDIVDRVGDKEFMVKTPLTQSIFISQPDASLSEVKEYNGTKNRSEPDVVPSLVSDAARESVRSLLDVGSQSSFEKKHTKIKSERKGQRSPKRSRYSTAIRKVMGHLSFQPSKRELAQLRRPDAVAISTNPPLMDLKLPEFEFRVSPIGHSFIAQSIAYPSVPEMPSAPSPIAPSFDAPVEEHGEDTVEVRQLDVTIPLRVTTLNRIGHRRYTSSPAVPYFRR
jgi:hypothetical protein